MIFQPFFLTIMVYRAPQEFSSRIIDAFLLGGETVIFQIILNILRICEDKILSLDDMGQFMEFFNKDILVYTLEIFESKKSYME